MEYLMGTKKRKLRSTAWYGKMNKDGFIHRSWMKSQGLPQDAFDGRPIIGICNTWSELTPCNSHLREIAEYVKRGVWESGGVPLEFPVMSLGETQMRPTAMLFRNLLSMDVEESIRANPLDGVVLLGGCDKTTPGQVMGACSVGVPFIVVSSGPMLNGKYKGNDIGSGTDVWKFSEAVRAGTMTMQDFMNAEAGMSRSRGTCMTMGTASTMASLMEALGLCLPHNGALPAVDARRQTLAHLSGRRIVEMVHEDSTPESILTHESFLNAIRLNAAIGGSTNAVMHLLAIAGRMGITLTLEDFDSAGRDIPLLCNLMPSGTYLMEDFCYAGGVPAVLRRLASHIDGRCMTVTGKTLAENVKDAPVWNDDVIHTLEKPVLENAGIAILRGNLCPGGAIIKPSAASPELLHHRGKAVVFESIEDYKTRIDSPELEVDKDSILVLKGCGPKGYPGMPEVGNMALPQKILEQGVTDMVRISDARMSGTAFGTVVLHVVPESRLGGPLALVKNGDMISLNVQERSLQLEVSDEVMEQRKAALVLEASPHTRGYYKLYVDTVLQADQGADLSFLVGSSGSVVTRESH